LAHGLDCDIGLLVNNVGASYDYADYFVLLDKRKIDEIVSLNINATVYMTQLVLPRMIQNKKGAIVNVSSVSGLLDEPLYAVYTASKAFVNSFSESLHYEVKHHGIHVQTSCPGLVATKMSKVRRTSFLVPSPSKFARALVARIGYESHIIPFWTHALQFKIASLFPKTIISNYLFSSYLKIRKRALEKRKAQ